MNFCRFTLALIIIVLLVLNLGSVIAFGKSGAKVFIRRGHDDIYLDAYIGHSKTYGGFAPTPIAEYRVNITYNSHYIKPFKYHEILNITQLTSYEISSFDYQSALILPTLKCLLEISGEFRNGMGVARAIGTFAVANGDVVLNLAIRSSLGDVYTLGITGYIDVDKNLVPREAEQQIRVVLALLDPYAINQRLAYQGITWIRVSKLNIYLKDLGMRYRFDIAEVLLELDLIGFAASLGSDVETIVNMVDALKGLEGDFRVVYLYNIHQESDLLRSLSSTSVMISVSHKDLEKFYRDFYRGWSKLWSNLFSESSYIPTASHILEIVSLPSNASANIEITSKRGEIYTLININNIRLGHTYLTGDEAVKRITTIVLSFIEIARSYDIPIEIVTDINVDYQQVKDLAQRNTNFIEGLIASGSLLLPPWSSTPPFGLGATPVLTTTPPYTQTRTTTIRTEATSHTTAIHTASTILSTIYQTTYKTLITTITTTMISTVVQQNTSLALILLVVGLIIGLATGYVILRRRT